MEITIDMGGSFVRNSSKCGTNERIEDLPDGSLLVHFDLGERGPAYVPQGGTTARQDSERGTLNDERRTKTIRIDVSERTKCEVWSRIIRLLTSWA